MLPSHGYPSKCGSFLVSHVIVRKRDWLNETAGCSQGQVSVSQSVSERRDRAVVRSMTWFCSQTFWKSPLTLNTRRLCCGFTWCQVCSHVTWRAAAAVCLFLPAARLTAVTVASATRLCVCVCARERGHTCHACDLQKQSCSKNPGLSCKSVGSMLSWVGFFSSLNLFHTQQQRHSNTDHSVSIRSLHLRCGLDGRSDKLLID